MVFKMRVDANKKEKIEGLYRRLYIKGGPYSGVEEEFVSYCTKSFYGVGHGRISSQVCATRPSEHRWRRMSELYDKIFCKKNLVKFRIWPDYMIQEYDELPYVWKSDDYTILEAENEEEAIELYKEKYG